MATDTHDDIISETCSKQQGFSGTELTFCKEFDVQFIPQTQYSHMSIVFMNLQSEPKPKVLIVFSFI